MNQIIVKATCLFQRADGKLLFSRGFDTTKREAFLRPLGGHVEFGESGTETIRREMQEEVGCDTLNVKFLSVIENRFTYNGEKKHEIVLIYEGELKDRSLYEKDQFMFKEGDREAEAGWFSKADVEKEKLPIYPTFNYFS